MALNSNHPQARRFITGNPKVLRWILAGPVALILAVLSMASLPFVFPKGPSGVDNLVFPVILFPLLWTVLVILPVSADHVGRIGKFYAAAFAFFIAVILAAFLF